MSVEVLKIDVSQLKRLTSWTAMAADTLTSIIYNTELTEDDIAAIFNVSPDVGILVYSAAKEYNEDELHKKFTDAYRRGRLEDMAKQLDCKTIVTLFDGYEEAYAFIRKGVTPWTR